MLKKPLIGLTTAVILFTASPARADNFETLLESIMTPEEAQVYQNMGNQRTVQLARQACAALDSGASVQDFATGVSQSLVSQGLPQAQLQLRALFAGKVIAAGVATFCPQHMSQLFELQLDSTGQ